MQNAIGVLLAGGVGVRLHPLTQHRAKPAVPFGGKYRIIDFTLSNCYHSGIRRVLVLTQYKSHSLQKHLRDGWSIFNPSIGEYITPVPPQMRTGESWYAGTADAVYQNIYLLERSGADYVLILSGDHIYRMDYADMLRYHRDTRADATVSCLGVTVDEARGAFGVMAVNQDNRIVAFQEKPADPEPVPGDPGHALASMGIYIFPTELLLDVLAEDHARSDSSHDFGRDILPRLFQTHSIYAYRFGAGSGRVKSDGYWRDVGTIDAYFAANMDLLEPTPPLDLYQRDWLIRTKEGQAPPARTIPAASGRKSEIENSMLGQGTIIAGGTVKHTLLFRNVRIAEGAEISDCVLFDHVRIGSGVKMRKCIVDKYVEIPAGESIGFDPEQDRARFTVSPGGIVVIPRSWAYDRETTLDG